jgi:exonuclease VII small subunit
MQKTHCSAVILALAITAIAPGITRAQTLIDTGAAASIGASVDAAPQTEMGIRDSIRQKLQNNISTHIQNVQNNEDYRNMMIEHAATGTPRSAAGLPPRLGSSTPRFGSGTPLRFGSSTPMRYGTSSTPYMHGDLQPFDGRAGMPQPRFFGNETGSSTTSTSLIFREMERERMMRLPPRADIFRFEKDMFSRQFNQALKNLTQIRGRIAERIVSAKQSGKDMSQAETLLQTADQKLAEAKDAVNALASFNATSTVPETSGATSTIDLTRPRALAGNASQDIKAAQRALSDVVKAIASQMGIRLEPPQNLSTTTAPMPVTDSEGTTTDLGSSTQGTIGQ